MLIRDAGEVYHRIHAVVSGETGVQVGRVRDRAVHHPRHRRDVQPAQVEIVRQTRPQNAAHKPGGSGYQDFLHVGHVPPVLGEDFARL